MKLPLTREAHQDKLPRAYTNEQLIDLLAETIEATRGTVDIKFHPEGGEYLDVDRARTRKVNGAHYRAYVESGTLRRHMYAINERSILLMVLYDIYRHHYDIASNTPMR